MIDAVAHHQRLSRRQLDQRPDGLAGAIEGPHLQPLGNCKQEDHGGRFEPVARNSAPATAMTIRTLISTARVRAAARARRAG